MRPPALSLPGLSVQRDGQRRIARSLPQEVPVVLVFNGETQAVMMATPADLDDFAVGFAIGEGIVTTPAQIDSFEIVEHAQGIEARLLLKDKASKALRARRRAMTGPVGCGLCGIDSLDQAQQDLPPVVSALRLPRDLVARASDALRQHQPLHDQTHAVHAAGFLTPDRGLIATREDVGRHNALDKLIGHLVQTGIAPGTGAIVLTSRLSVELVQKAALAGCPVLIAVSAPTALAVRTAETAGITLAAFARGGGFDLYSHPERIETGASDVA
ncbi:formate dehydrogenase accessory sulfurtransferase FdhD [Thalassobius sp. S69A]|uniref:formate dehydrogenase accessory sulfurtransferase FdhD n=1 Tax=unclassified Thalassovita TaxID=2619711 RepID=UPI000C10CF68|nr:sulfurtransferase FdhD [Paracoccaceae bacterium]MBT26317.1 sulfurtransferase FdhD [Paracoccaceae bacterium]